MTGRPAGIAGEVTWVTVWIEFKWLSNRSSLVLSIPGVSSTSLVPGLFTATSIFVTTACVLCMADKISDNVGSFFEIGVSPISSFLANIFNSSMKFRASLSDFILVLQ